MHKVDSIHGKQKIMYNGYVYVKQKSLANGVISYKCEKRHGSGAGLSECKAKIKVKDEAVIGSLHDHTHAPDSARCEVLIEITYRREHRNRFSAVKCKVSVKKLQFRWYHYVTFINK